MAFRGFARLCGVVFGLAAAGGEIESPRAALAAERIGHLQRVTGPALEHALRGCVLKPGWLNGKIPVNGTAEQFSTDGRWTFLGSRVPLAGTYEIKQDRLCVDFPEGTVNCRVLYRDNNDAVFVSRDDFSHAQPANATLTSLNDHAACRPH